MMLKGCKLLIDDSPRQSFEKVEADITNAKLEKSIRLAVIDNLDLLDGANPGRDPRMKIASASVVFLVPWLAVQ